MMSSAPNVIEFPGARARADRVREDELLRAASEERLRIARELHDVVAHSFATIKVQAGVALQFLDDAPEQLVGALHAIDSASKEALGELRSILGMMRGIDGAGSRASAPGVDRLQALAENMTAAGVRTVVVVTGHERSLPPAVDLTAFRIAQESLSNVLRHAGAASAVVTLGYERDCITVQVENDEDGHASPPVESPNGPGHGIVGMRERVAAIGGELEARLRPEGGFRVFARLPLFVRP
jgi:signal transduction histidine kinase